MSEQKYPPEERYEFQLEDKNYPGNWYRWTSCKNAESAEYEFSKTVAQSLPDTHVRVVEVTRTIIHGPTPGTHDGRRRGPFEGWS